MDTNDITMTFDANIRHNICSQSSKIVSDEQDLPVLGRSLSTTPRTLLPNSGFGAFRSGAHGLRSLQDLHTFATVTMVCLIPLYLSDVAPPMLSSGQMAQ